MPVQGIFFDLGGTLFSYRHVPGMNVPLLIESARRLGVHVDDRTIKHAYGRASREVSHAYADKEYYLHHDLFHDMFRRFCELIEGRVRRDRAWLVPYDAANVDPRMPWSSGLTASKRSPS